MPEGVTIPMIKLYLLLDILWNLDSIRVLDIVLLSLGSKYLEYPNEILGILGEVTLTFPLGHFKELIISCIGDKGEFLILFYGMHNLPCLFSGFP